MAVPAAYEDFNFIVNWGGTNQRMMSVGPLMRSNDVLEFRDGGDRLNSGQKAPGITRYAPIVLERRIQPGDIELDIDALKVQWRDREEVKEPEAGPDLALEKVLAQRAAHRH